MILFMHDIPYYNQCRVCINFSDSFNFVDNPLAVERPGIGVILIYLFFEGLIYFSLTLLIQV